MSHVADVTAQQGLHGSFRAPVLSSTALPGRRGLVQMAQRFSKAIRDKDGMMSTARVYADINVNRSKDYWEYAAQQTCLRCRLSLRNTSNIRSGHLQQLILVDKEHDISATLDSVADTRRLTPGTSDHLFYHGQWPAMHVVLHLHGIASQVTLHFWYS